MSILDALTGLDHVQFASIDAFPRPVSGDERSLGEPELAQRIAALTSIYHRQIAPPADRAGLVQGGFRTVSGAPLHLFAGGEGAVLARDDGSAWVTIHPGATAAIVDARHIDAQSGGLEDWDRLTIDLEPATTIDRGFADTATTIGPSPPTLNSSLLGVWDGPLGWLVVARPLPADHVTRLLAALDAQLIQERARQGRSMVASLMSERLETMARYLQRSANSGLWRVDARACGGRPNVSGQVAALLAASLDVRGTPYVVRVGDAATGDDEHPWSEVVSSDMLARLLAVPTDEVPGIRLFARSTFDVTPETRTDAAASIHLGTVLDHEARSAGELPIELSTLNRHAFICGATGSGKSQTTRYLLERISSIGVPWLVIEPAKAEYRRMRARIDRTASLIVIRPGEPDQPPAGLNPLEPEPGFPLQTHLDLVRSLFLAAFEADEPFPQVLAASLTRCYERMGWDLALNLQRGSDAQPSYPSLTDLQTTARQVVQDIGYGPEVRQNVMGFMDVRLSSLRLGTPGRFFEGGHPLDTGALLRTNCVIEIEDVGDDQDKAFLMGTILIRLAEHLRMQEKRGHLDRGTPLRHVTVFEEAHRLLRRVVGGGPAAHAVELFASLLAEVRAYGEGVIVVEQIPSKLLPDVVKNTALKVMHRLPARDDRELVGATMNLAPEQSEYAVTLTPGLAACFADGMDRPLLVRVPDGTMREAEALPVADPASVIGRRSPLCGATCAARPCTVAEIREAEDRIHGALQLWVELLAVAHMTGMSIPTPGVDLLRRLRSVDARSLECALAHGVESAVASRATAVARHYSPMSLESHLMALARSQLSAEGSWGRPDWRWQAGPFRWYDVHRALRECIRTTVGAGPHPRTQEWEERYDRRLTGATCAEQEQTVLGWQRAEEEWEEVLLFGTSRPSGLETAVGARREDPRWAPALRAILASLNLASEWPVRYLGIRAR